MDDFMHLHNNGKKEPKHNMVSLVILMILPIWNRITYPWAIFTYMIIILVVLRNSWKKQKQNKSKQTNKGIRPPLQKKYK